MAHICAPTGYISQNSAAISLLHSEGTRLFCRGHLSGSLVVLLGALLPIAVAQQQISSAIPNADYHLLQDAAKKIYAMSAFAHGHRHGYEEGFHAGDEDYHL